jgi:RNA polymerase-associated protein LEO1
MSTSDDEIFADDPHPATNGIGGTPEEAEHGPASEHEPAPEQDVSMDDGDALPAADDAADAPMDDLFGEDADVEERAASTAADGLSDGERERRRALEYDEPDDEPEDAVLEEVIEAAVALPKVPLPRSSDGTVRPHYYMTWARC